METRDLVGVRPTLTQRGVPRATHPRGRRIRVAILAASAVLLAGCSLAPALPESARTSADGPESFDITISRAIAGAEDAHASREQMSLLTDAAAGGEVTAEHVRQAARSAVDCMNTAGLNARYDESTVRGLTLPAYVAELGTEEDGKLEAALDACDSQEYRWVSMVFQTQPISVAVQDAHYEQFIPVAQACLEQAGYRVDATAPWAEVEVLMQQALQESGGAVNCFTDVIDADVNAG